MDQELKDFIEEEVNDMIDDMINDIKEEESYIESVLKADPYKYKIMSEFNEPSQKWLYYFEAFGKPYKSTHFATEARNKKILADRN